MLRCWPRTNHTSRCPIETHPQPRIHPPVKAQLVLTFEDHTLLMVPQFRIVDTLAVLN